MILKDQSQALYFPAVLHTGGHDIDSGGVDAAVAQNVRQLGNVLFKTVEGAGEQLAQCIQSQIVDSIGTVDRGVKYMPKLLVLKYTDMPAVLVEMAFIDNDEDAALLTEKTDEFARAIARGVTDYEQTL